MCIATHVNTSLVPGSEADPVRREGSGRVSAPIASRSLLDSLRQLLGSMPGWTRNSTTQAEVRVLVLDTLWEALPRPPFTDAETEEAAERIYTFLWDRGDDIVTARAA